VQKPTSKDPLGEHIIYAMTQIEDERKEICIHCEREWYAIHYRDGVCRICQQQNLPGRTELRRRHRQFNLLVIGLLIAMATTLALVYFK